MKNRARTSRGSALVIVLTITVLITVVILAAFANTQLSSQLSRARLKAFAATQYAQDGVEEGVARLRLATEGTNVFWTSQPGQITRYPLSDSTNSPVEKATLNSGYAANSTNAINLNAPSIVNSSEGTLSHAISDQMPLQWIYIRENGTRDTNSTYDAANRIVGRYAFWVDDESAKVNINTAWTPEGNTNALSHSSRVSLVESLPDLSKAEADRIHAYRTNHAFHSTLDVLRAFETNSAAFEAVREAKFWLTHFNASTTEKTFFGQPKIVLTTKKELARDANGNLLPYLAVSTDEEVSATVNKIIEYLSRNDWPMRPGATYQAKFYDDNKLHLAQLALNIIAYVKAKEEPAYPIGENMQPLLRGNIDSGTFVAWYYGHGMRAVTRGIQITRLGAWRNSEDPSRGRLFMTVYLPPHFGLSQVDFLKLYHRPYDSNVNPNQGVSPFLSSEVAPAIVSAGNYARISLPLRFYPGGAPNWHPRDERVEGSVYRKASILIRYPTAWSQATGNPDYVDVASVPNGNEGFWIPVTETAPATPGMPPETAVPSDSETIRVVEIDDPFLGGYGGGGVTEGVTQMGRWVAGTVPLSGMASAYSGRSIGQLPDSADMPKEQDVDENGRLTDVSLVFPAPPGVVIPNSPSSNPLGQVESLSELGYLHTGIQPSHLHANLEANVAWRTLRFQPRHPSATINSLPDWALTDLFTLPRNNGRQDEFPSPFSRRGVVNPNSSLVPFTNVSRVQPLNAWSRMSTNVTNGGTNILAHTLATGVRGRGRIYRGTTNFIFPAQIAEVAGVADRGEASEQAIRGLIDLASTQGNVFSIFSVGQSVIQSPDGKFKIQAENRLMSMVMRVESGGQVIFRNIFKKPLDY